MMPVVFAGPPVVAHAYQQIAEEQPNCAIDPPGPGNLLVTRVVAEKCRTNRKYRCRYGEQQAPPRISDPDYREPNRRQQQQIDRDIAGIVATAPPQQTSGLHTAFERRKCGTDHGERLGDRRAAHCHIRPSPRAWFGLDGMQPWLRPTGS